MSNPSSYYHTCIIYPDDFIQRFIGVPDTNNFFDFLDDLALDMDCDYLCSPLHSPDGVGGECLKKHFHLIFRCSNKITGNSFQGRLCDVLKGDFRGVAYHPDRCCINKISRYVRYLVHADNPKKEHFNRNDIIIVGNFNMEYYNAFSDEIMTDIGNLVTSGSCLSVADLVNMYDFGYALRQAHNMYYVNSLINDMKKEKKKNGTKY